MGWCVAIGGFLLLCTLIGVMAETFKEVFGKCESCKGSFGGGARTNIGENKRPVYVCRDCARAHRARAAKRGLDALEADGVIPPLPTTPTTPSPPPRR